MGRLVSAITGNPTLLLWIALACLALGATSGAGGAWYIQGLRIDALRAEYKGFVATVKAQGEAAKKIADAKEAADKKRKEENDAAYQTDIARLTADNRRMRDERARSRFVPSGPGAAGSSGLACFDRAELERALQQLDNGVSGLLEEGDADAVGLKVARRWASGMVRTPRPAESATRPPP